jgi:hypothetical protein
MKRASWVLLCLFLTACGYLTAQDVRTDFNPYLGQHYDSVVKELGPPMSCFGLSTGDKVCEWDRSYVSYSQGAGGTVTKRYHFVINKDGIITEWRWKGFIRPNPLWPGEYVDLSSRDKP